MFFRWFKKPSPDERTTVAQASVQSRTDSSVSNIGWEPVSIRIQKDERWTRFVSGIDRVHELTNAGKHEEALELMDQLVDLSDEGHGYCQRAHVLNKLGRYKEAISAIDRAIAMSTAKPIMRLVKAEVYLDQGDVDAALDNLIPLLDHPSLIGLVPDILSRIYSEGAEWSISPEWHAKLLRSKALKPRFRAQVEAKLKASLSGGTGAHP